MIPWPGDEVHDGDRERIVAACEQWAKGIAAPTVPEDRRCVSCDVADGGETGWCAPCWSEVVPPPIAPAVTEPSDTGCGRR